MSRCCKLQDGSPDAVAVDPDLEDEVRRHAGADPAGRSGNARADVVIAARGGCVAAAAELRGRVGEALRERLARAQALVEAVGRLRPADGVARVLAHRDARARARAVGEAAEVAGGE